MRLPSLKSITLSTEQRRQLEYRRLIQEEAKIGADIFGPIAPNGRREFFCLDEHTWIWHEEWIDANAQQHIVTTRYDVRSGGIVKMQDNQAYRKLEGQEEQNFVQAVKLYEQRVVGEFYAQAA